MAPGGLTDVRRRVADACVRSGRAPEDVRIVAVSKGRSVEAIRLLYDAGHRDFGENRSEELAAKVPDLPSDIVWHFVGPIQSRKTSAIVQNAAWIHSLERRKIADAIARLQEAGEPRRRILLQVNLAAEEQKHGAAPSDTPELLAHATRAGLDMSGLMLIPPLPQRPEDSRRWFRRLRDFRDELASATTPLPELSMGMTDDFEVAVEEGATVVRIGRAIFEG